MKFILLILLVLLTNSCRLAQHYSKYINENQYGRMHLKDMKFEKSFNKQMHNKIEADAIYFNYYEDTTVNYKLYGYIRFFSKGQYAIFSSNIESVDINDIQKSSIVGYYNVKDNILFLEIPNTSFSKAGKSIIREFEIIGNTLKEKRKKNETERIYEKVHRKDIKPVFPDW
jgi:hypothetical protein